MNKSFSYSILTYNHSLVLGEVINVGVLLIFPDENVVEFHYPQRLNRIKDLYHNFNESLVKDYLKAFEIKARTLNQYLQDYIFGYHELISNNLLTENASALQFEAVKVGFYTGNYETVAKQYVDLLLGNYKSETVGATNRITTEKLIQQVKSTIYELNPQSKNYLKFDDQRILKNNHVEFKSDFYWQNGAIHHAKAVSFDVNKENNIIDSALLLNAKLRQLEKTSLKNTHIDFIIQPPLQLKFNDAYQEACSILNENEVNKQLYTNSLEYCEIVANQIKPM
ncbi:MAG TPA: DUF3037 domain-containing protein [Taishania sp.]|nr:DUF3037 domain-containing protein [Taishania sp.]